MTDELRPCPNPWCDAPIRPVTRYFNPPLMIPKWAGKCGCGVRGPYCDTEAEAAAEWNLRGSQNVPATENFGAFSEEVFTAERNVKP